MTGLGIGGCDGGWILGYVLWPGAKIVSHGWEVFACLRLIPKKLSIGFSVAQSLPLTNPQSMTLRTFPCLLSCTKN